MAIRKFSPTELIPPADPVASNQALEFVRSCKRSGCNS